MYDAELLPASTDLTALDDSVARARDALLRAQRADGHWCFELEADATIPAEYVLLRAYLGEPDDKEIERKIGVYLRRIQNADGGWPLFHAGASDVSATSKAYFALKMIGDDPGSEHMIRARSVVLAKGGAETVNVFTRFLLALFGEVGWRAMPVMPVEITLLPKWFPIHLDKISYWARTVITPMLAVQALKPRAVNQREVHIAELFRGDPQAVRGVHRSAHQKEPWATLFFALDAILRVVEPRFPKRMRTRAIDRAVAFTRERLNGEDGLGAIYPAMAHSVMMYAALGYPEDHPERAVARRSIDKLLVVRDEEAYCQPCVSPVWDTALAAHALLEVEGDGVKDRVEAALAWLKPLQILDVRGDWAEQRPDLRPGGWAFQYANAHYPDTDDTAVVAMAMDRLRPGLRDAHAYDEAIDRAREWTLGMQSRNGGWGAFDADNVHHYLNNIPFADHGALLDPPTVDVSARCVGLLAQLGEPRDSALMSRSVKYLLDDQLADGSWFGRWGVNYVYGTWSVLNALNAASVDLASEPVRRAVRWLEAIQNPDGGWGEDCDSYKLDYRGYEPAPSNASQTAWAVLGLLAAGEVDGAGVERGVAWLQAHQEDDGLWGQEAYTGGGFPRVFYLRYHGYPKYFPLWALARYRNLKRGNTKTVAWGM